MVLGSTSSRQRDAATSAYETLLSLDQIEHVGVGVGIRALYDALANTNVWEANASVDSDRMTILHLIEAGPGFEKLNHRVNDLLRSWVREVIGEVLEGRSDTHSTRHAACCNQVGWLLNHNGEMEAAMDMFRNVLDIYLGLVGPDALETATCYSNIGSIYYSMGEYDNCLTEYAKAFSICVLSASQIAIWRSKILVCRGMGSLAEADVLCRGVLPQ